MPRINELLKSLREEIEHHHPKKDNTRYSDEMVAATYLYEVVSGLRITLADLVKKNQALEEQFIELTEQNAVLEKRLQVLEPKKQ